MITRGIPNDYLPVTKCYIGSEFGLLVPLNWDIGI